MMDGMHTPKWTAGMFKPVKPVIEEIIYKETKGRKYRVGDDDHQEILGTSRPAQVHQNQWPDMQQCQEMLQERSGTNPDEDINDPDWNCSQTRLNGLFFSRNQ